MGDLFPYCGEHDNMQEATIHLRRPELFHKFEFEAPGGGKLSDKDLQTVWVTYVPGKDGGGKVALGQKYNADGGMLLPGRYTAWLSTGTDYMPLDVDKDSPETLLFRLPPPVTYRGKTVDPVSGKPLAGAFVFAYTSISRNNLAMLSDDDWKKLEAMPAKPSLDDEALASLKGMYTVAAMVRTDDQGQYEIVRPTGSNYYALVAFARDRLPFKQNNYKLKPNDKQVVSVPDMLLFPAAKLIVKPVFEGDQLAVSPEWIIADKDQPDWFKKLKPALNWGGNDPSVEYVHWLKLNVAQPIYVPADVQLKIRLIVPYNDERCPGIYNKTIRMAAGASLDIGEITFAPALTVNVQVLDEAGKPVEGVPVRWKYNSGGSWCVAHNTDENGLAQFHVWPNSKGQFSVSDLPRSKPVKDFKPPTVDVEIGETAPAKPPVITLTAELVKALFGSPGKPAASTPSSNTASGSSG